MPKSITAEEIREDIVMDMREYLGEEVAPIELTGPPDMLSDEDVIEEIDRLYEGGVDLFVIEHG